MMHLFVMPNYDAFHRWHNDTKAALQETDHWSLVVLSSIVVNLAHGPWQNSLFLNQIASAGKRHTTNYDENEPLFQRFLAQMCADAGEVYGDDDSQVRRFWDKLKAGEYDFQTRIGEHVSATRWLSWMVVAPYLVAEWAARTLVLMIACLRESLLTGKEHELTRDMADGITKAAPKTTNAADARREQVKTGKATMQMLRDNFKKYAPLELVVHA